GLPAELKAAKKHPSMPSEPRFVHFKAAETTALHVQSPLQAPRTSEQVCCAHAQHDANVPLDNSYRPLSVAHSPLCSSPPTPASTSEDPANADASGPDSAPSTPGPSSPRPPSGAGPTFSSPIQKLSSDLAPHPTTATKLLSAARCRRRALAL